MLVEKNLSEALKDFVAGRKVRVIKDYDDGSSDTEFLKNLLPEEGCHYLVDVQEYENPEFEAAVHNMVSQNHKESVAPVETAEPEACGGGYP